MLNETVNGIDAPDTFAQKYEAAIKKQQHDTEQRKLDLLEKKRGQGKVLASRVLQTILNNPGKTKLEVEERGHYPAYIDDENIDSIIPLAVEFLRESGWTVRVPWKITVILYKIIGRRHKARRLTLIDNDRRFKIFFSC